ncbi:MAG: hypothetical protein AAF198_00845 [Pseudomonadota bacterium]
MFKQIAATLLFFATPPVLALDLELRDTWELNRPGSLAFDHELCVLWVANESRELVQMSIFGEILQRIETDLSMVKTVTPTTTGVLVSDWKGLFQKVNRDGSLDGAPYALNLGLYDTEGTAFDADGNLLVVQDTPAHMVRVTAAGDIISELDGLKTDPIMIEPQGLAVDPQSGHIFITDDREGSNSLFEFDPNWALISVTSLREYGLDPEAVAVSPQLGTMYIGFDMGAKIGVFDYTPSGDAAAPAIDVPFACGLSHFSNEKSPV